MDVIEHRKGNRVYKIVVENIEYIEIKKNTSKQIGRFIDQNTNKLIVGRLDKFGEHINEDMETEMEYKIIMKSGIYFNLNKDEWVPLEKLLVTH